VATDRSWDSTDPLIGKDLLVANMDLTDEPQIDDAYARTMERFGAVDVLINNAAMRGRELFPPTGMVKVLETKDSDWEQSFAVNVIGQLKVIRRFIRPMIAQRRGSIINTVSNGFLHHSLGGAFTAIRSNSREMPYQASKAAFATLSYYLADEVREHNVAVNCVMPTSTRTTGFDEQNRARLSQGMARPTLHPLVPEYMVPILLHLAAQDASGITGRMFDVMTWNIEHGHGGHEYWADKSFSFDSLTPT
jgi:NAD(P)-dependent dehydrogenase (short-subunit alcohol dehydrogenase family)